MLCKNLLKIKQYLWGPKFKKNIYNSNNFDMLIFLFEFHFQTKTTRTNCKLWCISLLLSARDSSQYCFQSRSFINGKSEQNMFITMCKGNMFVKGKPQGGGIHYFCNLGGNNCRPSSKVQPWDTSHMSQTSLNKMELEYNPEQQLENRDNL